jgi:hypothetical protein
MADHLGAQSSVDEATLRWDPEKGFDFDLMAIRSHCAVRISGVPIPADGTGELKGSLLDLDRLEILFKAQVTIHGEPGQLMEAAVQVVGSDPGVRLSLAAKLEDVETGDILDFTAEVPVCIPTGVPEAGGPRRLPAQEDDLDWEDEATFERMLGEPMDMPFRPDFADELEPEDESEKPTGENKGLEALLKALSSVDTIDEVVGENTDGDTNWGEALPASEEPAPVPVAAASPPEDGLMSAGEEARQFLDLLIGREDLELEEGFSVDTLVAGAANILQAPTNAARMAGTLSEWLLEQEAVADLYIDDDSLGELLSEW